MVLTRAERPLTRQKCQLENFKMIGVQILAIKSSKGLISIDKTS